MRHLNKCGTDSFAKSNGAEGRAVFKPLWICFFIFGCCLNLYQSQKNLKTSLFFALFLCTALNTLSV